MSQWWSWVLTALGCSAIYLGGRGLWWGWVVGLGNEVVWFTYSVTTRQWGFLVSVFAFGAVYALNLRRALRSRADSHERRPGSRQRTVDLAAAGADPAEG